MTYREARIAARSLGMDVGLEGGPRDRVDSHAIPAPIYRIYVQGRTSRAYRSLAHVTAYLRGYQDAEARRETSTGAQGTGEEVHALKTGLRKVL